MKQEPRIGHFLDEEEELIVKAINKEDYAVGASGLTPERLQALQAAARNTMNEKPTHRPKSDLSRRKTKAMQEAIPRTR
ncbi:hypothetical protein [Candidatus Thiosymbion oneisti]|uniref:hypothetical protein n=1 Tax=Candidatus Thiosymbion oneisti TaxID=589554 RepID=UPI000B7E9AE5|nr:hypothetical protein [Candidatus Thiosymbion oneisti]